MATLKATVKATSTDLTNDSIALSNLKSLTVNTGGVRTMNIVVNAHGSAVTVLEAADHASGTKVYLHNKSTVNSLKIQLTAAATHEMTLEPGGWAFFPWKAAVNIEAYASATNGTTLEYGTFAQV